MGSTYRYFTPHSQTTGNLQCRVPDRARNKLVKNEIWYFNLLPLPFKTYKCSVPRIPKPQQEANAPYQRQYRIATHAEIHLLLSPSNNVVFKRTKPSLRQRNLFQKPLTTNSPIPHSSNFNIMPRNRPVPFTPTIITSFPKAIPHQSSFSSSSSTTH